MAAVHKEYGRFLQWLRDAQASEDARRIAKIVHANLDTIIPTVNNGGQRATTLTPILRRDLAGTTDVIEETPANGAAAPLPWTRLKKLSVGPFRGFRREEQFDLSKNIVLFLGPNGSGKSSLCEAIEFALLGYVEEATAKRIEDLDGYFNNFHAGEHVAPRLWSAGADDGVLVEPNPEPLRFTIIEKNRIEGFARLAARPPAQASALIAALFGLDGFNSFVGNFTGDLDSRLRLATPKAGELALKNAALETARLKIKGNGAALQVFNEEQEALAHGFEAGLTWALLLERLGLHGKDGRLQQIHAALQEQLLALSEADASGVAMLRKSLRSHLKNRTQSAANLAGRAEQVSFLELYRAVHALQGEHAACPACETPLDNVTRNPFEKAATGIELLRDLAQLQQEQRDLAEKCTQVSKWLRDQLKTAHRFRPFTGDDMADLVQWIEQEEEVPVWTTVLMTPAIWRAVLRHIRALEDRDAGIRHRQNQRALLQAEVEQLEEVREQVEELRTRRRLHDAHVVEEQAKIDGFAEANAELIAEVGAEATALELEVRIQVSYEHYLTALRAYRDGLPAGLLADLSDTTKELYNSFNPQDHANDILADLTLPQRGGERIMVSFAGTPAKSHDALAVLSEGHLRCLGLAILLAKNIKLNLPLLVFDDAVNAIDHDHREGIRDTLFGDARLREKQMVITCHGNEFINQVQQRLGQGASALYILKHHDGDHQPRVFGGTDRHYLRRAIERLENNDERQALASSRQALENLTAKTWKSLTNRDADLGQLNLLLRGPTGEPELRNLVDGLSKAVATGIEQARLPGEAWAQRQEAFTELLQLPWRYLNKGTHDGDGEDFEIAIVQGMVNSLGKLSASFPG